jgi:hypothetical protein
MRWILTHWLAQATLPNLAHWKTLSFFCGLAAFFFVLLVGLKKSKQILAYAEKRVVFRICFLLSGAAAAGVLSVLGSYFDIFKKSTYDPTSVSPPDWHTVVWVCVWSAIAGYCAFVSVFVTIRKESEVTRSQSLAIELTQNKAALSEIQRQRDLNAKIIAIAGKTVTTKVRRFAQLVGTSFTATDFVKAADPATQLSFILRVVCDFYASQVPNSHTLLGVFMRDPGQKDRLTLLASCDSQDPKLSGTECFPNVGNDQLKLMDVRGVSAPLAPCFHGPAGVTVIGDVCAHPESSQIALFMPQNALGSSRSCTGSLVLYKHVFFLGREPEALVLLLATDQPQFFVKERELEVKQFLSEMLSRMEMELLLLTLIKQLKP